MATYFHGNSEIQGGDHGMQTLYLMNPNYVPFSETTLLLNPAVNAFNPSNVPHAPPSSSHHHPLMGIPLPGPTRNITIASSEDVNNRSSSLHGTFPGVHYDLWGSITPHQIASLPAATTDVYSQSSSSCRQGLSLSLSPKQAAYNNRTANNGQAREQLSVGATGNTHQSSVSVVSNGIASLQNVILDSKYLRAAHELLDEVVNVLNVVKAEETRENLKLDKESMAVTAEGSVNIGADHLTTPQKQELQLKKAKLVTMLDEVEQRYRQYHEHMKVVITSFEQAAGLGSAKSYTALALRTISKQFRCLKDAINEQIKGTSKKLGEEDCLGAKVESSRQRYIVDHDQLRQHFSMMQHNAWRPQRGLPERAVSILRAWLFEHFLHPYPKDSDKQLLAKQTGLTRSQVSNWFINARVRLWKPMVEEMYLEEMKEQDQNGPSAESASKTEKSQRASQESKSLGMKQAVNAFQVEKSNSQNASPTQVSSSVISTSPLGRALQTQNGFNDLTRSSQFEGVVQTSPKKPKCTSHSDAQNSPINLLAMDMEMKEATNDHGGGFGAYTMGGIGRFNPDHQLAPRFHGNGVSLTLGLPQQSFLSSQHNIQVGSGLGLGSGEADFCGIDQTPQTSHDPSTAYENIEIQNRKRFAAQLLPDFVT